MFFLLVWGRFIRVVLKNEEVVLLRGELDVSDSFKMY